MPVSGILPKERFFVIETNIRLVEPGTELELDVRYARVEVSDDSPDLLWKACGALQGQGLAALPSPGRAELVVATDRPVPDLDLRGQDWHLKVRDAGRSARLRFKAHDDGELLERLMERLLLIQVQRRTDLWRLNTSASIWYERKPFMVKEGIAAYRRYEISGVALEDVGVGIAVDVGTAFFTKWTVADFFREDLPQDERERRERRFEALSARQKGQKGTLLYAAENSSHSCYFDRYPPGVTCSTTGELTVHGKQYGSLLDYYEQERSGIKVDSDDPVAYVSFTGIDRPQPVAAKRLRLRVMNDSLPRSLKQADKISPEQRSVYIAKFWKRLGERPLGRGHPVTEQGFWRPPKEKLLRLNPPALKFGGDEILPALSNGGLRERRDHFRERSRLLDRSGCLEVPPAMTRMVHFAVPQRVGEATATRLAEDVVERLSTWTGKRMRWELVAYQDTEDAYLASAGGAATWRRRLRAGRRTGGVPRGLV